MIGGERFISDSALAVSEMQPAAVTKGKALIMPASVPRLM